MRGNGWLVGLGLAVGFLAAIAALFGMLGGYILGTALALAVLAGAALFAFYEGAAALRRLARRLRAVEYAAMGTSLLVAAAVASALRGGGWPIAVVLAVAYGVAMGTLFLVNWRYAGERAPVPRPVELSAWRTQRAVTPMAAATDGSPAAAVWADRPAASAFRVVGARGTCPLGYRKGEVITVGEGGAVSPHLCPAAEAVLRLAAAGEDGAERWCCPVYEHLLVFQRERIAA